MDSADEVISWVWILTLPHISSVTMSQLYNLGTCFLICKIGTNHYLFINIKYPCGCENWTIKKAEHQKIDAFKLWCWRSLLRVLWKARRSNQSILKPINPEYSLEGLSSNTLATPCEESSPWKRPWCWERLKAKGEEDEKVR